MSLGLQNLQYFISVADNKSFVETSKKTWVSAPAVSYHISKLESYFGTKLFNRSLGNRSIQLTSEGKILYDLVKPFITEIGALHDYWKSQDKRNQESLITIGATFIHANYILPILIPMLQEEYEETDITISVYTDNNSKNIMENVSQSKTDIGMIILSRPEQIPGNELKTIAVRKERLRIVVGADYPTASGKSPLDNSAGFSLIIPPPHTDPGYSLRLQLIENKIQASCFIEVDSIELAKKVVLGGINVGALLPEIAVLRDTKTKKFIFFDDNINLFINYAIIVNPKNINSPKKRKFLNSLVHMYNTCSTELIKMAE